MNGHPSFQRSVTNYFFSLDLIDFDNLGVFFILTLTSLTETDNFYILGKVNMIVIKNKLLSHYFIYILVVYKE